MSVSHENTTKIIREMTGGQKKVNNCNFTNFSWETEFLHLEIPCLRFRLEVSLEEMRVLLKQCQMVRVE